jgi:hypothetical protein
MMQLPWLPDIEVTVRVFASVSTDIACPGTAAVVPQQWLTREAEINQYSRLCKA